MLSKSEAGKETPEREKMGREPGTLAPGEGEMEGRLGRHLRKFRQSRRGILDPKLAHRGAQRLYGRRLR